MPLKEQLIEHIRSHGPMNVAKYMAVCASHYYATRDPFGAAGDFTTAPEISQVFGELIGAWLDDRWHHTCASQAIICEMGPGRGTLMKDILRVTRNSGLHENIDIHLIEASPALREIQTRTLKLSHTRIYWHDSLENLPPLPLFLVANEFFDALPIHQYTDTGERKIDVMDNRLVFTPEGKIVRESSPMSVTIMAQIATHIKMYGGVALIIDYGYDGETQADTLQAVKAHQYAGPLEDPGEADITAHVDFRALKNAAVEAGAHAWDIIGQGAFLTRLGAELRATALCKSASPQQQEKILSGVGRLLSPQQMGRLFKVMAVTSDPEKPPGF